MLRIEQALIEQINIPELTEVLFDSSCHGKISNLTEILTAPTKNVENIRFEAIQYHNLLQVRNDQTRTCLDLAAMLGHHDIVKLLTEKSTTMMTDIINLTNGIGKLKRIIRKIIMNILNRIFKFTSCLCMESIRIN